MGFLLLAALSALAAAAALAVTVRARPRGRAEALVAATMLWNLIIVFPIYVVGLLGVLTARSVAVGSLLTSTATLVLAARGRDPRALAREVLGLAGGLLRLPGEALRRSWHAHSLVFLGLAFTAGFLPYLALCAYFGQAVPHWDPLWYHDAMVGFTIQNHGFAMVDLPPTLQKVNGYVRLGEMTQLWMVIFADRRLADITNLLFAPMIAASVYLLARRTTSAVMAMGWGVAVLLMPACANLLHGTYVDPQNAALLLGGIVFATLRAPRLRDAWLAALGLALAIGSKGLSLVPVPVAAVIGAVSLLHTHWRSQRRAALLTLGGGAALIIGTAAITYLRNYWHFHNPLWPDMRLDLPELGIHWPGQMIWTREQGVERVDMNEPFAQLRDHLLAIPWSVRGIYYDQAVDYGIGVVWIALPLAALAWGLCLAQTAWRWLTRHRDLPGDRSAPPLALALILTAMIWGSPALCGPRYHIAAVGLVFALVAWLTGRPPRDRIGESAVSAVLVMSLMMFYWTPAPHWWFSPSRLRELARRPAIEREVDRELGAPTSLAAGLARERELGPGSLLVFNERYGAFPSLFWNNTFSNRIQYLPGGPDFLARAAKAGATWVYVFSPFDLAAARAAGSGWQEVAGALNVINGGAAFRRTPAGTKPKAAAAAPPPAPPPRAVSNPLPAPAPAPPGRTAPAAPKPKVAPALRPPRAPAKSARPEPDAPRARGNSYE